MDKKILMVAVVVAVVLVGAAVLMTNKPAAPGSHSEPICNNDGSCVTPEDENNCPSDCRNPSCRGEGESFLDAGPGSPIASDAVTNCCEGLQKMDTYDKIEGCIINKGPRYVCVNCGNGICGTGENICNCPQDCAVCGDGVCDRDVEHNLNCPQDCNGTCGAEGETIPSYPGAAECCAGLSRLDPAGIDSVTGECLAAAGGVVCSNCGNGVCESWENRCNCPQDCPS